MGPSTTGIPTTHPSAGDDLGGVPTTTTVTPPPSAKVNSLTIRRPDDLHHHCRDGPEIASVLVHVVPRFARCLMMPNLKPPVTTVQMALDYKERIMACMPPTAGSTSTSTSTTFQPLMTLYLTDHTSPEEIKKAISRHQQAELPTETAKTRTYDARGKKGKRRSD